MTIADEQCFERTLFHFFEICGIRENQRKRLHLTKRSSHALFDNLSHALMWRTQVSDQLGRWARGSSTGYAHRAACDIQLRIRARMIQAVQSLVSFPVPMQSSLGFITCIPSLTDSEFYGPLAI